MDEASQTRAEMAYFQTKVTREEWLGAARDILVRDGVENVKVLTLSQTLNVSRSSFYWYFKNRDDLFGELLEMWRRTNTRGIIRHASAPSATIVEGVLNVFDCWVDERLFDPRLDFAVREWARRSDHVRRIVDLADAERLTAIRDLFVRHGYDEADAFIRARILYFMQIGYYALNVRERLDTRLQYLAAYLRGFTGIEPSQADLDAFVNRVDSRKARPGFLEKTENTGQEER